MWVGDCRSWWRVVVRGGVLSLMDGGWSFVVVWVCGVVVRVGRGRPQGVVVVRGGLVVVRAWGVVVRGGLVVVRAWGVVVR